MTYETTLGQKSVNKNPSDKKKIRSRSRRYYIKFAIISFIYALAVCGYFGINSWTKFLSKAKFDGAKFKILQVEFSIPSTSNSLITTLVINTILATVLTGIIIRLYYVKKKKNDKECVKHNSPWKTIGFVTSSIFIGIMCELLKVIIREFNYSIKNSLGNSILYTMPLFIIILYLASFSFTVMNRIVQSYNNNTKRKLNESDLGINKDKLPDQQTKFSIKKTFFSGESIKNEIKYVLGSWRKFLSLSLICGISFGIAFLMQETLGKNQSFTNFAIKFTIEGNTISLITNQKGILLLIFIDMLIMQLGLKIIDYLNHQEKIQLAAIKKYNELKNALSTDQAEANVERLNINNEPLSVQNAPINNQEQILDINNDKEYQNALETLGQLKSLSEKKPSLTCALHNSLTLNNLLLGNLCVKDEKDQNRKWKPLGFMKSLLFNALITSVCINILTSIRDSMQNFTNPQSAASWVVCFIVLVIVFAITVGTFIDNITNGKVNDGIKKKDSCLSCATLDKNGEIKHRYVDNIMHFIDTRNNLNTNNITLPN